MERSHRKRSKNKNLLTLGNIYANDSIDNGITVFEPIGGNIVKIFPPFQGIGVNDLAFNLQGVLDRYSQHPKSTVREPLLAGIESPWQGLVGDRVSKSLRQLK